MKLNNYKLCWFYEISNEKNNHISIFRGKQSLCPANKCSSTWPLHYNRCFYTLFFCLTLLCSTTTLCVSPLSHVSMALHMLQILSSAGAWWSGQPNSRTCEWLSMMIMSNELLLSKFVLPNHEYTVYVVFVPYGLTLLSRSVLRSGWAPEIRKRVYQNNWWTCGAF